MNKPNDLGIIVMTSDKYFSLIEGFLFFFDKANCYMNNNIYIGCESIVGIDTQNIKYIKSNSRFWSKRLSDVLNIVEEKYVLILLDDFYFIFEPDCISLQILANELIDKDYDLLRPYISKEEYSNNSSIKLKKSYYLKNRFFVSATGYYKKAFLIKILRTNENPWEFEFNAATRAMFVNKLNLGAFPLKDLNFGFPYSGVIARGKLIKEYHNLILKNFDKFYWRDVDNTVVTTKDTKKIIRLYRIIPRYYKLLVNIIFNKIK